MIWRDMQLNRLVTDHRIPSSDWVDSIIHMHSLYLYEEYRDHGVEHLCDVLSNYESYTGNFLKNILTRNPFLIWQRSSEYYGRDCTLPDADRIYLLALEM